MEGRGVKGRWESILCNSFGVLVIGGVCVWVLSWHERVLLDRTIMGGMECKKCVDVGK